MLLTSVFFLLCQCCTIFVYFSTAFVALESNPTLDNNKNKTKRNLLPNTISTVFRQPLPISINSSNSTISNTISSVTIRAAPRPKPRKSFCSRSRAVARRSSDTAMPVRHRRSPSVIWLKSVTPSARIWRTSVISVAVVVVVEQAPQEDRRRPLEEPKRFAETIETEEEKNCVCVTLC